MPAAVVVAVALGILTCVFCGFALSWAMYRRSKAIREAGPPFDSLILAGKRQQRQNTIGGLLIFGGIMLGAAHTMFGVREFRGAWVAQLLLLFAGLVVQFYAVAAYIKALDRTTAKKIT